MDGTIEEVVTSAPLTVRVFTQQARQLPDEVLASLEAVKAAQMAARERARRERWQAWAMIAGIAGAATLGVFVVRPRFRAGRAASAATASAVTNTAPAAQQLPAPLEQARTAGVPSPLGLLAARVAALPATKASLPAAIHADNADLDTCRDSYAGKRWRSAAEACATAFASRPNDARLALRVAEAQYARDHLPEAREWAQRTLALDAKQADALAILAHAEQRSGDSEAAARAFRRYLALAPRGWHSAEARAALHSERPHAPARTPPPEPSISAAVIAPMEGSGDAPLRPTAERTPLEAPASTP